MLGLEEKPMRDQITGNLSKIKQIIALVACM